MGRMLLGHCGQSTYCVWFCSDNFLCWVLPGEGLFHQLFLKTIFDFGNMWQLRTWNLESRSKCFMKGFARVWVQQQQSYWALVFSCGAKLTVSFLVGRKGVWPLGSWEIQSIQRRAAGIYRLWHDAYVTSNPNTPPQLAVSLLADGFGLLTQALLYMLWLVVLWT